MPIPKVIYQTYKTDELPFLTKWHIYNLKKRNPEFEYQFYDDQRVSDFIQSEFGSEIFDLYSKINIGAAKADFFRYAILYKKGGIYLDIDSLSLAKFNTFIQPSDSAIISLESNLEYYVQWALVYEPGHPFLAKTLEIVIDNLKHNRYPNDVHAMTGPSAYTKAIRESMTKLSKINYRELGADYEGKFKFHYRFSKFFIYGLFRKKHWRTMQEQIPVLK